MHKKIIILILVVFSIAISCKSDFDLNEKYKEIGVIYGILDSKDTTHYIRINKAFLGEGNSLVFAQNPDSINFPEGVIKAEIREIDNGKTTVFKLDTITLSTVDSGIFSYPKRLFYKADFPIKPGCRYEINVVDTATGYSFSSSTNAINTFRLMKPNIGASSYSIGYEPNTKAEIEFSEATYGKKYQPSIVFHYYELASALDTIKKSIEFKLSTVHSTSGGSSVKVGYIGSQFYNYCLSQIPYKNAELENKVFKRIGNYFEIKVIAVDENFSIYSDLVNSSSVSEIPNFTNVTNGYGIFASRSFLKVRFNVSNAVHFNLSEKEEMKPMKFVQP